MRPLMSSSTIRPHLSWTYSTQAVAFTSPLKTKLHLPVGNVVQLGASIYHHATQFDMRPCACPFAILLIRSRLLTTLTRPANGRHVRSGAIESHNRGVMQARMKKPEAFCAGLD